MTILCSWVLRAGFYEVYLCLHLASVVIVITTIFIHSSPAKLVEPPRVYLLAAICLWGAVALATVGHLFCRRSLRRVEIETVTYILEKKGAKKGEEKEECRIPVSDSVHISIPREGTRKPKAGQIVYLCVPGVATASFAQFHPFYISWWDKSRIYLVVQAQRGFTRNLILRAQNGPQEMRAIVDGPYGNEFNVASYDDVIFVATGMGIAGQTGYMRRLLLKDNDGEAKIQRIHLFWEIESEGKRGDMSTGE